MYNSYTIITEYLFALHNVQLNAITTVQTEQAINHDMY